jgi:hypothetical protein
MLQTQMLDLTLLEKRNSLMIAIALDTLVAYLLSRKKLKTFQYLIYGFIAAFFISAITSGISSSILDEKPGVYFLKVINGIIFNSFFIYIEHYFIKSDLIRKIGIKKAVEKLHAEDQYWEQNEHKLILQALEKYKITGTKFDLVNPELEFNISRMSTEEIIKRLDTENFAEESIPSALKVLNSRL